MAASVATGSSNLHSGFNTSRRLQGGRQLACTNSPALSFNGWLHKDLSWSQVAFKVLEMPKKCNLSQSAVTRRLSVSSCIGDGGSTKYFDFAVIGSGVAGLRYALEVAKHGTVAVITKAELHESNTNYAQGGVSAVLCPKDSVESHMQDTIVAGAYLCDEETVRVVCTEGPERIRELIAMGAMFDHGEDGNLHLAREGGHSHRRIVHAADMTGREIERALLQAVINDPNISVFQHHFAIDLLTSQDGPDTVCRGVDTLNTETQEVVRFLSRVTLLASGGAGHIYPCTTNPLVATGDGMAMAHRAQAVISNMEFVQFHPTALADEGLPIKPKKARENAFLISEAVRGDGGILYNLSMERFMPKYDERAELAPRDVVARAIDDQLKKHNDTYVLLDISHTPREKILSHFPNIAAECLQHGLDITRQPIPVVPAAHYMCGGVRAGLEGETNVRGLYVAGEVACTGLHGANRLASNSLLEALVFARRAVQPSIDHKKSSSLDLSASSCWARPVVPNALGTDTMDTILGKTEEVRRELQSIMWRYVGIVRSTTMLKTALERVDELETQWEKFLFEQGWKQTMVALEACEMRNLFCSAKLVVGSAMARQESRGLHYTIDFPHVQESMRLPTVIFPSAAVNEMDSMKLLVGVFGTLVLKMVTDVTLVGSHADVRNCKFPAMYNFGDSNSDTGGISAALGEIPPPNGETFFGHPSGRSCDGRLIIDFIAERLKLPYLSAYLDSVGTDFRHGANFATGGSSIRPGGYSPFHLGVQISQFKQFKARTNRLRNQRHLPREVEFSKALYTFEIGQNDLAYGFQHSSEEDVWKSIPDILNQFAEAVKQLYKEGAKFFWVHNTGPLGCLPYSVIYNSDPNNLDGNGCVKSRNNAAQEFNRQLERKLSQLKEQLPRSSFTYVDVYSAKYRLISTAENQGFVHPMEFCCGSYYGYHIDCGKKAVVNGTVYGNPCTDPSRHVSWDGVHYSEAANLWVANRILNGSLSRRAVSVQEACKHI
ncbi:unnamed protein product [Linum tenue]|uniref:L-aspartate oxidase n=1 Tax=Linum tenue TaxID=586396 RepID=A0AAV0NBX3_9ROSI|nr:unnamed protein product [Linum tenue]